MRPSTGAFYVVLESRAKARWKLLELPWYRIRGNSLVLKKLRWFYNSNQESHSNSKLFRFSKKTLEILDCSLIQRFGSCFWGDHFPSHFYQSNSTPFVFMWFLWGCDRVPQVPRWAYDPGWVTAPHPPAMVPSPTVADSQAGSTNVCWLQISNSSICKDNTQIAVVEQVEVNCSSHLIHSGT
jgi:hypothetical protein